MCNIVIGTNPAHQNSPIKANGSTHMRQATRNLPILMVADAVAMEATGKAPIDCNGCWIRPLVCSV